MIKALALKAMIMTTSIMAEVMQLSEVMDKFDAIF